MFLLSRPTYYLLPYAVLACVWLALHPCLFCSNALCAADMRRDRRMGASFTLGQEALGVMLLDIVHELLRDQSSNLNDNYVLNHVFHQTRMRDGRCLALTFFMTLWVLAVVLGVVHLTPPFWEIHPKQPLCITQQVEGVPRLANKGDFQRDDSNTTVLDGSLDGIVTGDSLDDTVRDLSDAEEEEDSSSDTAQVVVVTQCLLEVVVSPPPPPRANDNFQREADCYAERKKGNFKDPSLERHRQEFILQKLKLKRVEDPEIARKKKLAVIREKHKKESKDPYGLNEIELEELRNNLKKSQVQ